MVRIRIERHVEVARPAADVWDYVTDWPRQAEWIPQTRVENLDSADQVGGRFRAWTGVGPVGFWDPMTITSWERSSDGGGRCEVLHRGAVVKGEGEFAVESLGPDRSRFVWAEMVVVPAGRLGALAWRVARPVVERLIDVGLGRMRERLETQPAGAG